MSSMESTLGRAPRALDQLDSREVKLGQEKHNIPFNGKSENLEVVLTRPLLNINHSAILKVKCWLY